MFITLAFPLVLLGSRYWRPAAPKVAPIGSTAAALASAPAIGVHKSEQAGAGSAPATAQEALDVVGSGTAFLAANYLPHRRWWALVNLARQFLLAVFLGALHAHPDPQTGISFFLELVRAMSRSRA